MPKNIENTQAFETLIQQNGRVVAVDFWAPWCGPCQAFGPILDQAAEQIGDQAEIVKVNIDDNPELARQYGITSIPTVVYFRDGQEADRAGGIEPAETIVKRLQSLALQEA